MAVVKSKQIHEHLYWEILITWKVHWGIKEATAKPVLRKTNYCKTVLYNNGILLICLKTKLTSGVKTSRK